MAEDSSGAVPKSAPCFMNGAPHRAPWIAFLVLSWIGILFVFRSAVWNESLIAPLDLPPTLFSKFKWMDPAGSNVPKNHYVVDMFDYELPRQYLAHDAIKRGEFPWWNPYTDGGLPYAAESHISIFDPVRLSLYKLFPFEMAFNWTLILHSFMSGVSMFVLLRTLKFSSFAILFGSLSYQFATNHVFFVFPPAVRASFLYYPLLWSVWHSYMQQPSGRKTVSAAVLCMLIFVTGNQQCYAFFPFFAGSIVAGYSGMDIRSWRKSIWMTGSSVGLGCLLALPVIVPQLEIYLLSTRNIANAYEWKQALTGLVSAFASFFPWSLGTFKTLDLGKAVQNTGLGFVVFIGSAGMVLALFGLKACREDTEKVRPELRTAIWLNVAYFIVICSTPLLGLLYTRASDLAVIGLTILATAGVDYILKNETASRVKWGRNVAIGAFTLLVVSMHLMAFVIFPKVKGKVTEYVLEKDKANVALDTAPALRIHQIGQLPEEITFKNPEVLFAYLSVVALLVVARTEDRRKQLACMLLLGSNLAPMLLYSQRFLPCHPVTQWTKLLEGGPEQLRMKESAGKDGRVFERAPGRFEYVLPGVTALYYKIHTLNGYATFQFHRRGQNPAWKKPNFTYVNEERGLKQGILETNTLESTRFIWSQPEIARKVTIQSESLNEIKLKIDPGEAGTLLRDDTWYPGWLVVSPQGLNLAKNNEGLYALEVPSSEQEVLLRYRPSYHGTSLWVSGVTATGCLLYLFVVGRVKKGETEQAARPGMN